MRYDMVVSDFDDTLLGDDHNVSGRSLAAISAYVAAGGKFVLCTGRMLESILAWARRIGLAGYLACYQGGLVANIETGEVLHAVYMENADVVQQLSELERRGMHAHLYHNDTLYVQRYDALAQEYERLSGIRCAVTGRPLHAFAAEKGCTAHKLMAIDRPEVVAPLRAELAEKYPHLMYVLSKPEFLEIVPRKATKAAGMEYIAAKLGVEISRVAAVGDSLNDLPMIERAGLGVAVANAAPEVKAAAGLVLPYTNNEDAVARLIEDYAL